MKKILLSIILIFTFQSITIAKTDVVIYGDCSYTPYSYLNNRGEPSGVYVDILKSIFSEMTDYNVLIELVPWNRGMDMIRKGIGFALFPPYYRPERSYLVHSVPILDEIVVAFCREDTLKKPRSKWPQDYFGLKVGKNSGFDIGGEEFKQAVIDGKIILEEAMTNRSNILKLIVGRIDVYINDRLSILWSIKELKKQGKYEEVTQQKLTEGTIISVERGYLVFTLMDDNLFDFRDDFIKKFNTILVRMKTDGTIQKIVNNYIE
jgi:polar amino acid transport system substrate-binding protein